MYVGMDTNTKYITLDMLFRSSLEELRIVGMKTSQIQHDEDWIKYGAKY